MKYKEYNLEQFRKEAVNKLQLMDEVTVFESDNKNKIRNAESIVDYIPMRDKVLILAAWLISPNALTAKSGLEREEPVAKIILGFGDETHNIQIGDFVQVNFSATIQPVEILDCKIELNEMKEYYNNPLHKVQSGQEFKKQ